MPSTSAPYGFRPVKNMTGAVRPRAVFGGILSGYTTALYQGTPIIQQISSAGGVIQIAANSSDWLGVFSGVQYTDTNSRTQYSKSWVASTSATNIIAYIWDEPYIEYQVQTDGAAALSQANALGQQFQFSAVSGFTVGAGSATTQLSTCAIAAANVGSGTQGMFRVLDLSRDPDNAWGDTYLNVIGNIARHQYVAVKVAI